MKTQTINYIPRIDHLRFFAAFSVMIFHFAGNDFTSVFDIGVNLFFTLSGFIFMLIAGATEQDIDYKKFIYNRFLRIFPLVIVLFFTVTALMRESFHGTDIFNLLFLNMPSGGGKWGWGSRFLSFPWWTVGVEFTFYLAFPFILKFYKQYGLKYLLQLILFILILRYFTYYIRVDEDGYRNTIMSIHYSILGHLDTFIIGMMAGILYLQKEKWTRVFKFFASKIVIIILLIGTHQLLSLDMINPMIEAPIRAILCGLIIISYLSLNINFSERLNKLLAYLGSISFSVYLLHEFVADALKNSGISTFLIENINFFKISSENVQNLVVALLVLMPVIFLVSMLSYTVIEKPFLKMRVKYLKFGNVAVPKPEIGIDETFIQTREMDPRHLRASSGAESCAENVS